MIKGIEINIGRKDGLHRKHILVGFFSMLIGGAFYFPADKAVFQIGGVYFTGCTEFYGQITFLFVTIKFVHDITQIL